LSEEQNVKFATPDDGLTTPLLII